MILNQIHADAKEALREENLTTNRIKAVVFYLHGMVEPHQSHLCEEQNKDMVTDGGLSNAIWSPLKSALLMFLLLI